MLFSSPQELAQKFARSTAFKLVSNKFITAYNNVNDSHIQ